MEFTNLAFGLLLGFLLLSSYLVFFSDLATRYTPVANASPILTNLSFQVNASAARLESISNVSITQSTEPTRNLDLTAAVFGYVTGAINAVGTLAAMPALFLNFTNAFASTLGFFIPPFVGLAVSAAIYFITIIGLLLYFLKVK